MAFGALARGREIKSDDDKYMIQEKLSSYKGLVHYHCIVIIALNGKYIPAAIAMIVENAFNGRRHAGSHDHPFPTRSVSNEAGLGSAAIAHSTFQTK